MAGMGNRQLSDLFPTRWSFVIFILYMALFINQGILVTASQTNSAQGKGYYNYNTVMAVLLTEFIKLWVSAGIFIQSVHSKSNTVILDDSSWFNSNSSSSSSSSLKRNKGTQSLASSVCASLNICSGGSGGTHSNSHSHSVFPQLKCNLPLILYRYFNLLRNSATLFCHEVQQNRKVFFLYFIPAGLYCLYNNLAYTNLVNFDPTTYFLLLQFRVVVTGIVFQMLFQKQLSKYQWISLIFLTIGCMVKEVNFGWLLDPLELSAGGGKEPVGKVPNANEKLGLLENPTGILLILLQVLCSSSAGVYNEFLLKRPSQTTQKQLPVLIQNVCLYIDSIICNLTLLLIQGNLSAVMDFADLRNILSKPIVLAVVINNAAIGIVTSFFLAQLNSILKTFASALELMFTAVLCWMIFGIPIHFNTAVAIVVVTVAIWLYSKEPVHNPATGVGAHSPQKDQSQRDRDEEDMQRILDEELDV